MSVHGRSGSLVVLAAWLLALSLIAACRDRACPAPKSSDSDGGCWVPPDMEALEEEDRARIADYRAEVKSDLAELDAFIARATSIRVVRTKPIERGVFPRVRYVEPWKTLDTSQTEELRAMLRTLEPHDAPACGFQTAVKLVVAADVDVVVMELCFRCNGFQAFGATPRIDLHWGLDRRVQDWAATLLPGTGLDSTDPHFDDVPPTPRAPGAPGAPGAP
jgi:hypothetical protein